MKCLIKYLIKYSILLIICNNVYAISWLYNIFYPRFIPMPISTRHIFIQPNLLINRDAEQPNINEMHILRDLMFRDAERPNININRDAEQPNINEMRILRDLMFRDVE